MFPSFLEVTGQFELSTRAHLLAPQTVLIHLHLASITSSLHFDMLQSSLTDFFPHGGLHVLEVPFDFATSQGWETFDRLINDLRQTITGKPERVTIVITNHTDDTRGDPFIGRYGESGEHVATPIEEVSPINIIFVSYVLKLTTFSSYLYSSWTR